MRIRYLTFLAGMIIAATLCSCDEAEYVENASICRECGAHKHYQKHWNSEAKIEITDTPESLEIKRLFPDHKEHKWVDVCGSSKKWGKPALCWDGSWRGWQTFSFIVNSNLTDDQKRDFLRKFYAIEQRPWKKSKDYKAFKKYEESIKKGLNNLTIEVAKTIDSKSAKRTFTTPYEAAYEALMKIPEGQNVNKAAVLNDSLHKGAVKPATIDFFKKQHRYREFDFNDDGVKEYIFELNEYIDKTCGRMQIECNSGGCKWAIIQKTPDERYVIQHIEPWGGWPIIYESKTNGWHDIVITQKGIRETDGIRWGGATKLVWNGNDYTVSDGKSIRKEDKYDDYRKFLEKNGLGNAKEIGPQRP